MPDMTYHDVAVGTAGGLIGSGAAAMSRKTTGKDLWCAVLVGMSLGAFVPPFIQEHYAMPWPGAGLVGLILGLCVFAIIPWVQSLADRLMVRAGKAIENKLPPSEEPKQ